MYKISIITINYNNFIGLKKTFNSVVNQTNKSFEYLVIDGGSTDGSKEFIESKSNLINFWVSEKDTGVYNAMNKGIKQARGEYILFLNSGDYLVEEDIIDRVIQNIVHNPNYSIYYGNLFYSLNNKRIQVWTPPEKLSFSYFYKHSLPHPSSFIKRDLFDKHFYYSENYKIVSDWEFFIYCICKADESYKYIDITISDFDNTGVSSNENNLTMIQLEKEDVYNKHFQNFINDYKSNEICDTKKFKQIKQISKNKSKWNVLKAVINLLYLFESKKKLKQDNYFHQL